jgi:autotransporter-associated beta strand protein
MAAAALIIQLHALHAANIALIATDPIGSTSFNTGLNWANGVAPASGNAYQTAAFLLRTPPNSTSAVFAGDSLEVQSGGNFRIKTAATITVANLILDNTATCDLTAPSGGNSCTLAGNITLNGIAVFQSGIQASEAVDTLTISAPMSGSGGFTITGSFGTIILTATNSYSGATTVNGGIVLFNGINGSSPVTITSGTLGGNGIIQGPVTNQAGGTLRPGLTGTDIATLSISNALTLSGTTAMVLNRGNAQTSSKIIGILTLTEGGALTVANVGAALQLGDTFTLFSASAFAGNFNTITLPALNAGLTWSNSLSVNGTITVVAAQNPRWISDADGIWSATTNWANGIVASGTDSNADFSTINISADRTVMLDSSRTIGNLIFGDTTGAQNWIMNSSGGNVLTLAVSSGSPTISVTNNSATLNLPIAGTAGLTKSGAGTLVLSGNNSYTGETFANAGTLSLASIGGGGSANNITVGNSPGSSAVLNILPGANITNNDIIIGETATSPGAIFQSGGTFTQAQGANIADFRIGDATSAYGYYQLSGGTLNANEVGIGGGNGGNATIGVMDITGGNYVSPGFLTLARGVGSLGAMNVSGGTVSLSGTVGGSSIGLMWNGSGASYGELNIFGSGSVVGPANTTYLLNFNPFSGGGTSQSGVVNLNSGGTLQIGGVINSAPAFGTSLLNFNGGTLKAQVANPAFISSISGAYIYSGGAVIDDNGAAIGITQSLLAPSGYGVRSISLTSGGSNYIGAPFVLISGGSGSGATARAQMNFASGQITNILITSPGSGYANTDALTVTLNGGGGSGANIGTISLATNSSGGLTKLGAGTLTLSGANTYSGKTIVSNGTLLVNGSLAGGALIANGATLTGSAIIQGALTNLAGGTLQTGMGGTDTSPLIVSNSVSLAGTTIISINRTNAQNAARLSGITTLAEGGALIVTNVGPSPQVNDTFTLFNASAYVGNFNSVALPTLGANLAWSNTLAANGAITVVSTLPPTNSVITNLAASQIFATSATLNGQVLSTGGSVPNITIFYGTINGGTNAASWSKSILLGQTNGTFSAVVAALATNTTYYFTAFASNSAGISWAQPALSFTTLAANPAATRIQMLTYHYDNTRQGANANETLLTPANVNTNTFGKLFSYSVDGYVYTEPLIMTNVTISGQGVHDVVLVATEHGTLYAFDANDNSGANGGLLWKTNLGFTPLSANGEFGARYCGTCYPDIVPEVGVTGTPVIDPATGTIYVNMFTREITSTTTNYIHRIHAIDVTSGQERSFSPVIVAGSVPGRGVDSSGGVMTFNAKQANQRPALCLANGMLYVTYAGYADTDPYHGWLFGYNATNLTLLTNYIYNTTPNATTASFGSHAAEGGIWMGGGGICVDANNNLFFETGNGSFSANTNGGDFADTFMKISTTNGFAVADYFTPFDQASLAAADTDLGSCGPILLPDSAGSASHPHLLAGMGKSGKVYLMDRDAMTTGNVHYQSGSDSEIVQSFGAVGGTWSPPSYWNGRIYCQPSSGAMKSFSIANAAINTTATATAAASVGSFNGGPVISANGTNNGIAWLINGNSGSTSAAGILYAFNATNISQLLWSSAQLASRDSMGNGIKMTTPTVAGGKVYVGAQYTLSVYGVQVFLDTPIISPAGAAFTNAITITLSDASTGASIYYTTDGTTPTSSSILYTGPFVLTSTAVVKAIAIQPGSISSAVASASFVNTAALGNGIGLKAEYFTNHTSVAPFVGSPVLVQTNATVSFNWSTNGPDPSVGATNFTVRWTGSIQPQFSEPYVFYTTADDGVRLYLNGQLLIDDWTDKTNATTKSNTVSLVAQQLYTIELDYYQKTNNASVTLSWSSTSVPFSIVPQTQLYPYTNPPPAVVLTAPANNSSYTAAASVTISATADAQYNPLSAVSFYANGIFLGSVSNVPFTLTATGLGAGNYNLTAVAVDGSGLSATSAPVNITVNAGTGQPYGLTSNGTVPAFLKMPTTFAGSIPPLLSMTGVFSNTPSMIVSNGLIPYMPNTPLWSDGALKTRFMAVPNNGGAITPDEQIAFAPTGSWTFPAGTVFVKTFELNTDTTNPNVRHRLETRLLVRDINGAVYGVTYKWRADNSDADLLSSSLLENILITNASGLSTQTWYYPSPSDCLSCHTPVANYVLGVNTRQLNGNQTYATGVTDNQLRTLNRLGMFNPAFDESGISTFEKLSSLTNTSASFQDRARSYLDANCAQCHQPGGTGITFDARYDTPLTNQNLIYGALDTDGQAMIVPRDIWRSEIHQRMNTTNSTIRMPPLGRLLIDSNAVAVLEGWINSLPGTPALAPVTITPNGGNFFNTVGVTMQPPDTNAAIYFTLDGSMPTTNSFLYSGAFNLTSNATISASAFETNYINSLAASALFFVQPLQFASENFSNGIFRLQFVGTAGSNYVLLATTNFQNWTPLMTNPATTNVLNFMDPKAGNYPSRFYRVLQQ